MLGISILQHIVGRDSAEKSGRRTVSARPSSVVSGTVSPICDGPVRPGGPRLVRQAKSTVT
jgi:hypothetical protein